ncbi:hypothetical protein L0N18_17335 [Phocaeicola dorei]|uniref:hypothetical protein n=2 Tax=Phocaeicola dorei TaxID=357276 RepID=UPI001EDD4D5B|nr:hypothetical protein [Phocaeicola dorei]MCG4638544.1 hypothetical protein [Phocaeicola dorei]
MSDLNLDNIVGFKAVDKDGNEQNVTVDEMVEMVSTRMVMALSETSTFAAVAATGNDVYENELPTVTDAANVRVLQSSGDAAQMTMQSLASKLGGLLPNATGNNAGLMSSLHYSLMTIGIDMGNFPNMLLEISTVNPYTSIVLEVYTISNQNIIYGYGIIIASHNGSNLSVKGSNLRNSINGNYKFYYSGSKLYVKTTLAGDDGSRLLIRAVNIGAYIKTSPINESELTAIMFE